MVTLYDTTGTKLELIEPDEGAYPTVEPICPVPVLNTTLSAWVSHVNSVSSLYLNFNCYTDKIPALLQSLFEHYEVAEYETSEFNEGDLCAAKSDADGNWYRGRVEKNSDDTATILYIDYGNNETLPLANLKVLDLTLFGTHEFALNVALNLQEVSEELTATLRNLTEEKLFTVTIIYGETGWLVDLTDETMTLSQSLIDLKLANSIGESLPIETICEEVEPEAFTQLENDLQQPEETRAQITITHIDSPSEFYVQLVANEESIFTLQADLQEKYSTLPDLEGADIGVLCAVKYAVDEQWYRAEVLDADAEITTVRFIDYGNTDVIGNNQGSIKTLPPDLLAVDKYARKCSLNVLPSKGDEWSQEASEMFENSVNADLIYADIVYQDEKNKTFVELYIDGKNIVQKLLDANFAVSITRDIEDNIANNTGFVSHLNSVAEFWIQLESSVVDLEMIVDRLASADTFPDLQDLSPGILCAANFPDDEMWYRARILSNTVAGIEVLFVDYGNSATAMKLKVLPEDLIQTPILAQKCSLNKPASVTTWSDQAIEKFREISADGVTIFTIKKLAAGETSVVELFIDGQNIAEQLIELCDLTSVPATPVSQQNFPKVHITHVEAANHFWVQMNSDTEKIDDMMEQLATAGSFKKLVNFNADTTCAALHADSGLWYRAKIYEAADEVFEVILVDYGNIICTNELRLLTDDIESIPPLATLCALELPKDVTEWSSFSTNNFNNILAESGGECRIEFVDTEVPSKVRLYIDGKNIAEQICIEIPQTALVDPGTVNLTSDEITQLAVNTQLPVPILYADDEEEIEVLESTLTNDDCTNANPSKMEITEKTTETSENIVSAESSSLTDNQNTETLINEVSKNVLLTNDDAKDEQLTHNELTEHENIISEESLTVYENINSEKTDSLSSEVANKEELASDDTKDKQLTQDEAQEHGQFIDEESLTVHKDINIQNIDTLSTVVANKEELTYDDAQVEQLTQDETREQVPFTGEESLTVHKDINLQSNDALSNEVIKKEELTYDDTKDEQLTLSEIPKQEFSIDEGWLSVHNDINIPSNDTLSSEVVSKEELTYEDTQDKQLTEEETLEQEHFNEEESLTVHKDINIPSNDTLSSEDVNKEELTFDDAQDEQLKQEETQVKEQFNDEESLTVHKDINISSNDTLSSEVVSKEEVTYENTKDEQLTHVETSEKEHFNEEESLTVHKDISIPSNDTLSSKEELTYDDTHDEQLTQEETPKQEQFIGEESLTVHKDINIQSNGTLSSKVVNKEELTYDDTQDEQLTHIETPEKEHFNEEESLTVHKDINIPSNDTLSSEDVNKEELTYDDAQDEQLTQEETLGQKHCNEGESLTVHKDINIPSNDTLPSEVVSKEELTYEDTQDEQLTQEETLEQEHFNEEELLTVHKDINIPSNDTLSSEDVNKEELTYDDAQDEQLMQEETKVKEHFNDEESLTVHKDINISSNDTLSSEVVSKEEVTYEKTKDEQLTHVETPEKEHFNEEESLTVHKDISIPSNDTLSSKEELTYDDTQDEQLTQEETPKQEQFIGEESLTVHKDINIQSNDTLSSEVVSKEEVTYDDTQDEQLTQEETQKQEQFIDEESLTVHNQLTFDEFLKKGIIIDDKSLVHINDENLGEEIKIALDENPCDPIEVSEHQKYFKTILVCGTREKDDMNFNENSIYIPQTPHSEGIVLDSGIATELLQDGLIEENLDENISVNQNIVRAILMCRPEVIDDTDSEELNVTPIHNPQTPHSERIFPGSVVGIETEPPIDSSTEEKLEDRNVTEIQNQRRPSTPFCDKIVPGSICRGDLEIPNDDVLLQSSINQTEQSKEINQTCMRVTPSHNDKIVPGSICRGEEKVKCNFDLDSIQRPPTPFSERIVPGSVARGDITEPPEDEKTGESNTIPESVQSRIDISERPLIPKTPVEDKIVPGCITGIDLKEDSDID